MTMKPAPLAVTLLAATLLLTACKSSADRTGRLLSMAGEEAANITNKMDRFTRQLHIAETQLRTDRKPDAARTLALAQDTLKVSTKDDFDDFHRIAAWTAISQLARQANDRPLALKSADAAQAALNDVQPAAERPQYVLSLAGELAELRGNDAAIELINSGGAWAAEIVEPVARRTALTAFTNRLLSYDAYESARTMLRRDPDPVWRTDMFLALANTSPVTYKADYARSDSEASGPGGGGGRGGFVARSSQAVALPAADVYHQAAPVQSFGKDVRYESVYQNIGR
jgi:hypothetical protein